MLLEPQALLSGVKNGNRLMFTLCYDRYHRGIYLFVLKYVRCEALAEDIVQEVFFRLWCNRRGLREEGNLAALLYAMAVNAIRKHKIVETGNVRYYDLHEGRQEPAGESDSDETMRRLRLAVGELPARQRTIFNLKIYESRSNQEIAGALRADDEAPVPTIEEKLGTISLSRMQSSLLELPRREMEHENERFR